MSQAESQDKNPDVVPKAKRRQFTAAYKRQILQEVDACTQPGEKEYCCNEKDYLLRISRPGDANRGMINASGPAK